MKTQRFVFQTTIDIDEDDVRNYLGLDDDDETELTDSDFDDCAHDFLERDECEYYHISTKNL